MESVLPSFSDAILGGVLYVLLQPKSPKLNLLSPVYSKQGRDSVLSDNSYMNIDLKSLHWSPRNILKKLLFLYPFSYFSLYFLQGVSDVLELYPSRGYVLEGIWILSTCSTAFSGGPWFIGCREARFLQPHVLHWNSSMISSIFSALERTKSTDISYWVLLVVSNEL